MAQRVSQLSHIDVARIGFSFSQTRSRSQYGTWASITPLRFEGGAETVVRRGRRMRIERIVGRTGVEYIYIFRAYLPRLWDLPFEEKLQTIVHELLHISPEFNGDIRRFGGRCYAHGANQKHFDACAAALGQRWRHLGAPETLLTPLRLSFGELCLKYRSIVGMKIGRPRIVPVTDEPKE